MDWNRAKKIVIGMLILVNLFLVGMYAYLRVSEERVWRDSVERTVSILKSHGIELDPALIPRETHSRRQSIIPRDTAREAQAATALLGENTQITAGNTQQYQNENGNTIKWYAGGAMSATFALIRESGGASGSLADSIQTALGGAGFTAEVTAKQALGGAEYLDLRQTIGAYPVFNCQLRAVAESEQSVLIDGWYCFGEPQILDDASEMRITGLLIHYASAVEKRAVDQIDAIEPGWLRQTIQGVGVRLIPVWRICAGDIVTYMNAIDGFEVLAE